MNRMRAKFDKDSENKDIKKKLRNVQAKVHSNLLSNSNPNPTSIEKSGSLTAKNSARRPVANRSNNLLIHSERCSSPPSPRNRLTSHRQTTLYEDVNTYQRNVNIYMQQKQPLSMYMNSSFNNNNSSISNQKSRLSSNRQKKQKTKTSILPAISDNEPVEEVDKSSRSSKSVHELYTPRNEDTLSSSSSDVQSRPSSSHIPVKKLPMPSKLRPHSPAISRDLVTPLPTSTLDVISISSGSTTYLNLDLDLVSLSSPKSCDEIYHMAPLIPAPSAIITTSSRRARLDSSATLIRKFRNALARGEHSMPEDDIKVVKNVLKTDKRANLLKTQEPDSNLFKDILKTQLDEIVKSEKVVTNALRMLGAPPSNTFEMSQPIEVYNVLPMDIKQLDNRRRFTPRGKIKSKRNIYSTDSSPRGRSSFEADDFFTVSGKRRHVATDTLSMKDSSPRSEILNAYFERNSSRSPKRTKRSKVAHTNETSAPHKEFEAFVKSTLPFKRKSASLNRPVGQQTLLNRQKTLNDDLKTMRGIVDDNDFSKAKESRRPQVDVTFKNVPSVEKEILILKALGKRLEETLKRSVSEPSLSGKSEKEERDDLQVCSSTSSLTRELKRIDPSIEVFPGRRSTARRTPVSQLKTIMDIVSWNQLSVGYSISAQGLRLEIGIVKEFVIIAKTVNELLSESSSELFIANENEPGGLEPIPLKKVVEQPQVLMQYLIPKSPANHFNLMDQDAIFFSSFLLPGLKTKTNSKFEKSNVSGSDIPLKELTKICGLNVDFGLKQKQSKFSDWEVKEYQPNICEGGDSLMVASNGLPASGTEAGCSKYSVDKLVTPPTNRRTRIKKTSKVKLHTTELPVSASASQRAVQRARMRRVVTPMPVNAYDDPKNNLIKTILVGAVQVSIFLLMIMAITYPDIKC